MITCPRCETARPETEFGIARSRKSGRNLYCKPCNRERVYAHRDLLRELQAKLCFCGCGMTVTRGREYRQGHCFKGMFRSEEWRQNISASMVSENARRARLRSAPEQRVLFAINEGARTQDQIKKKAKILDEQLGLALVNLMLVEKKVVSRVNRAEQREYFIAA